MSGFTLGVGTTLGGVTVDKIKGVSSGTGVGATQTVVYAGRFRWGGGGGLDFFLGRLCGTVCVLP